MMPDMPKFKVFHHRDQKILEVVNLISELHVIKFPRQSWAVYIVLQQLLPEALPIEQFCSFILSDALSCSFVDEYVFLFYMSAKK